jgi:ABC-2 type transport system permease protein
MVLALLPTLVYYYTLYELGNPKGNIDSAGVVGSYIGLVLLGAVFTAIGTFASSISENQIVSFIIAVFLCFVLYIGISAVSTLEVWGNSAYLIGQFGLDYHYNAMGKGLIDSRDVAYFLSIIAITLSATKLVLGSRQW